MPNTNSLRVYKTLAFILLSATALAQDTPTAGGFVFNDLNRNGVRDAGEPGLPKVLVSNQREVAVTGKDGAWRLPVRDDCIFFVIKPSGWMVPVDDHQLPQFHYIHKPKGSPASKFPGVAPTGPLPGSIDFPLHQQEEPKTFKAHFFGDTQARNRKELDFMARDTIAELIGSDAAFGVTLGDIMFDDLSLFETHNGIVAMVGIPWWNVIGNHDLNFDSPDDKHSDESFERVYGPSYYAYSYGPVHFVTLDNVKWGGSEKSGGTGSYTREIDDDQMAFLENLLPLLPENELLMLMMHIPLKVANGPQPADPNAQRLYRLIEKRPYTMSISGHTHWHAHFFLDEQDGWKGARPHHHVVNVTVCGSWWSGEPDERGIPHAMMADGAPRGYSTITFDGHQATVDFKATRRPADYQLRITAPDTAHPSQGQVTVFANVFNGSPFSKVRMRLGDSGKWISLRKTFEVDPDFLALKKHNKKRQLFLEGRKMPEPKPSHHLWKESLPLPSQPGIHRIWVQTEDMYGRTFDASHVIRVE